MNKEELFLRNRTKKKGIPILLFSFFIFIFSFVTCENEQVIGILKAPSELVYLDVSAAYDEFPLTAGAALEPGLRPSLFNYTVYVVKDANRVTIDAGIEGTGSVVCVNEVEGITATAPAAFDYPGDAPMVITIRAQRDYMEPVEYRLTVERMDAVPVAENVWIEVQPGVAAFFIGQGVLPDLIVHADLPAAGGELSYQWYINYDRNNITGRPLSGATGATYTMREQETMAARSVYYYVEIINTLEGKTGMTRSDTRSVTFLNKGVLAEKSIAMIDVPATTGTVTSAQWTGLGPAGFFLPDWSSTDGFRMGQNLVTMELWETVRDWARKENYYFSRSGNQGGARVDTDSTITNPRPIGNKMHPVTNIGWRDAIVWCNAYSEMDGLAPVYRDANGDILRDSRQAVDRLVDQTKMIDEETGKPRNGYRLPHYLEWLYAAHGANPSGEHWGNTYPGTNSADVTELAKYVWAYTGTNHTGEVGKLLPNQLWDGGKYVPGLHDMSGMVYQWVFFPEDAEERATIASYAAGMDFVVLTNSPGLSAVAYIDPINYHSADLGVGGLVGFRLARSKDK